MGDILSDSDARHAPKMNIYATMITPFSLASIGSWLSITAPRLLTEFVGIMISFWMQTVDVSLFNVRLPRYYRAPWIRVIQFLFVVSWFLPYTLTPDRVLLTNHCTPARCAVLSHKSRVQLDIISCKPHERKTWEKYKFQTSFQPQWKR